MHRLSTRPALHLLAALCVSLALVGCGGSPDAADTPPPVDAPSLEEQDPITTEGFEEGDTGALNQGDKGSADGADGSEEEDG